MRIRTDIETRPHAVIEAAHDGLVLDARFSEKIANLLSEFGVAFVWVLGLVIVIREVVEAAGDLQSASAETPFSKNYHTRK